jgi:UDP-glucose 4-epimerase
MARVLVTGGAGYIGSHTVVALTEAGHDVVILDDLRRSTERIVAGIAKILDHTQDVIDADIADTDTIIAALKDRPPIDAVVHFAAYKSVKESVVDPLAYYRNNIGGTAALIDALRQCGVTKLVFSSSCTVYGQPEVLPVTEQSPTVMAASPYGYSKQVCEQMIVDCVAANVLTDAISLRYFNPAGAHESALIGELPIGVPDNLVPFITQTAAEWRPKLQIFGSDYNTPDGTAIRDYLHVMDLAEAHVAAVEALLRGPAGLRVYNLGMGKGVSVKEMVTAFEEATGVKLPHEYAPRRPGDIEQTWSSCDKAERELGWKTKRSLNDIMSSAWAWQQTLGAADRT